MKLLSIVLPIYNVEIYLEKCLLSLLDQDVPLTDYEIICVIDGSPDNSRDIVIQFQNKFTNILLVEQENQGVSGARNNGISIATGQYIMLIDPDDYIESKSLGRIIDISKRNKVNMALCGFTFRDSKGIAYGSRIYEKKYEKVYSGIEAYRISHSKGEILADSSVAILFESTFLFENQIKYLNSVPYLEDGEFISKAHCLAERCIFISGAFYNAINRQESAQNSMHSYKTPMMKGFLIAAGNLKRFQEIKVQTKEQKRFINGPIIQFVLLYLQFAYRFRKEEGIRSAILKLKNANLRNLNLGRSSFYYIVCGLSYNISPYFGMYILIFYLKLNSVFRSLRS